MNGNVLENGDSVIFTKFMKVKGTQIHLIQVESMNHMLFSKNPLNSSNKILESMGFKLKKKFLFPALNFFDVVYERK